MKILIVEDEKLLADSLRAMLEGKGFTVEAVYDGETGAEYAETGVYDLLILDVMMPGLDGYQVARQVRARRCGTPILMLTARSSLEDRIEGLNAGADYYLTKPFDTRELLACIGALLRRARIASSRKIEIGKLTLDADERTAYLDGAEVPLTVREFNLLYKLLSYPKKTFTRSQLMEEFWDVDSTSSLRTVDVYMAKLREKFANCKDFSIVTVHGLGYKAVLS